MFRLLLSLLHLRQLLRRRPTILWTLEKREESEPSHVDELVLEHLGLLGVGGGDVVLLGPVGEQVVELPGAAVVLGDELVLLGDPGAVGEVVEADRIGAALSA